MESLLALPSSRPQSSSMIEKPMLLLLPLPQPVMPGPAPHILKVRRFAGNRSACAWSCMNWVGTPTVSISTVELQVTQVFMGKRLAPLLLMAGVPPGDWPEPPLGLHVTWRLEG